MGTIIITLGGVSVICAAGFGITTALKWFNEYEYDVAGRMRDKERERRVEGPAGGPRRGGPHEERLTGLRRDAKNA